MQGHLEDISRPCARAPDAPAGVEPRVPAEAVAPLLAGARARGMADAFELMGYGVVMLDRAGRVLFASERARRDGEGVYRIVSDHVVGAGGIAKGIIAQLIGAPVFHQWVELVSETNSRHVALQCLPGPRDEDRNFQLLDRVLLSQGL